MSVIFFSFGIFSFYPEDLAAFTRKPLFVIVDSDCAPNFTNVPKIFNKPFMCLMAPAKQSENAKSKLT